ncbi:adenylate/guanylate cyclase domain-containing protein [Actinoplanes auranticolor]|uniref:adenylate/guanylate cyclase domain-containing protein n=1 Tax=Actinoplanes auranticolor TaxID=47988 RepID=UPI001BB3A40F|nr:adenylate/guanylate cyclase domain-containing protein [Actinoplanes auranticolor]
MSGRTELPSGLVTFMFTDIEGSTRLARMLGEGYGRVLNAHRGVVRAALSNYAGAELFTEGDSFFVAFRDAASAVSACVAAQRALAAYPWPSADVAPRVRMGLHTGWAVPVAGEYTSAEVHRAARVAAAAHGGQVLCSEATALAVTTWSPSLSPRDADFSLAPREAGLTLAPREAELALREADSSLEAKFALARHSADLTPAPRSAQLVGVGAGRTRQQHRERRPSQAPLIESIDLLDLGPFRLRGFDDDERLFQLVAPGLERDFPRPRTPDAPVDNLPAAVTPFVGRQSEIAELKGLISTHRLVTVAGTGGAGKSRLAVAAAEELRAAYPDGIWLVDLAEDHPAEALAAAMGVRREPGRPLLDSLIERCAEGRVLLILDTCEARHHAARELVRRLLTKCRRLDVLATSRTSLGVPGELVWRIPQLAPADAYALLAARATAARGGRPGPAGESTDLARIAAKLDGVPLAIELAADRLRLLSAAQLAGRLDDPIAALDAGRSEPGRHGSLTSSLDWSYHGLSDSAAGLLRRLAVFAGPVELGTVEWSGEDAFGALSELADRSLVEVVTGPRYQMSEQVRAYATRRLAAAGEERAARDRHVDWSLHTLDGVAVDTDGQPRTVSLTELAPYVQEWQAALRWSATGGSVGAGLRLAGALAPWWREYGRARDGRDLLFRLYRRIDEDGAEPVDPVELASAYLVHAGLADDREERTRFLDRAEDIARRVGHSALLVRALAGQRLSLVEAGRTAEAEKLCREVIARAERTGVPAAALPAVVTLAELLWRRDALDEAAELLGSARQLEAGRPEDRGSRTVDWMLGMVALRRRDLVAAHDHLVVALRSRLRHGFRGAAADAVAAIAVRCAVGGDPGTATVLFGGAESVRGACRATHFGGFWSGQQAALRRMLGDAAFDAAYADGAEMGFGRAVAIALAVEHPDLEHGSARFAQTLG